MFLVTIFQGTKNTSFKLFGMGCQLRVGWLGFSMHVCIPS